MVRKPERLTPEMAWEKMKSWCAYQERCQSDTFRRLRDAGLTEQEANVIISRLIEENYLNEERFAVQFAGGHFRLKKWGRQKIEYALRQKQITDYCIRKAMASLEEPDYQTTLDKLLLQKFQSVRNTSGAAKKARILHYLLQKGYTRAEILSAWQRLENKNP